MANHIGQSRRRSLRRRRFKIVAFSFFLVIFLLSSTMALKTVIESSKAKSDYSELPALMRQAEYENTVVATKNEAEPAVTNETGLNVAEKPAVADAEPPIIIQRQKTSMDFSALKEINPDIIGWIRAEGTNIDYPIAQTDNNEYYLNHLYNKDWNSNGTIFADYRNTGDFSDRNTVIYGHHMRDLSMFGTLDEYNDKSYIDAHRYVYYYTAHHSYRYRIVGVVERGSDNVMYKYSGTIEGQGDFSDFVNDFNMGTFGDGWKEEGFMASSDDHFLLLSTCVRGSSHREIVVAVREEVL